MTGSFWCALAAESVFAVGLAICVVMVPSYVLGGVEGGVSNYGADRRTVVPFTLSFGGNAALIAAAAGSMSAAMTFAPWITAALSLLALLLSGVLVSAWIYKRGHVLRVLHFAAGIVLLAYQSIFGLWLTVYVYGTWVSWLLWVAMLAGDAVCILALRRIFEKLFAGQVMACIAFGVILLMALA